MKLLTAKTIERSKRKVAAVVPVRSDSALPIPVVDRPGIVVRPRRWSWDQAMRRHASNVYRAHAALK